MTVAAHPAHVLLVEDHPGDAALVSRALMRRPHPFYVHCAATLGEAQRYLCEYHVDVILLDLSLPDCRGLESVCAIREQSPGIPIIMLTGLADDEVALDALQHGAQDYLTKDQATGESLARAIHYAMQRERVLAENQRLMAELEQIARNDPLTGVLNRHFFSQQLERAWRHAVVQEMPLSCLIFDVDFFKKINDSYGHVFGDEVLKAIGRLLATHCRPNDHVSRYGGEEFCVLLPDTDEQQAVNVAGRLRRAIAELPFTVMGETVQITVSFGAAERLSDTSGPQELINLADQSMLVAKQLGRNRVVSFSDIGRITMVEGNPCLDVFQGARSVDIMNPIVVCLNENKSVGDAVDLLLRMKVDSAPVVNDEGLLVGLISEEELTAHMMTRESSRVRLGQVMNRKTVSFNEDAPVWAVYEFLSRVAMRRVIVEREGEPIGVISRPALLRWLRNQQVFGHSLDPSQAEDEARWQLNHAVSRLRDQVDSLQEDLQATETDTVAALIASATRMQELIDELLGHAAGNYAAAHAGV